MAAILALFLFASIVYLSCLGNAKLQVPAMGWNSWNYFGCNVSEAVIRNITRSMRKLGLQELGYRYINVDDCWSALNRDKSGRLLSNPDRFPHGISALSKYVHEEGFSYGIYSSAGFETCQGYPASLGMELIDAKTFSSWEVNYLKYDNCYGDYGSPQRRSTPMANALSKVNSKIVFSLCEWGRDNPAVWAPSIADSWRVSPDIKDHWDSILSILEINAPLWRYAGPESGWNDPDMLEVGNGGMTYEEYQSHFSLWAIMKAPLIIGADISKLTANDEVLKILGNKAVIAVNQDPLGRQARRVWSDTLSHELEGSRLILTKCATGESNAYEDSIEDQTWTLEHSGLIRSISTGLCLTEYSATNNSVHLPFQRLVSATYCTKATKWHVSHQGGYIISKESNQCLEVSVDLRDSLAHGKRVQTAPCHLPRAILLDTVVYSDEHQMWAFPNNTLLNLYQVSHYFLNHYE